jgi:hypothetical protein
MHKRETMKHAFFPLCVLVGLIVCTNGHGQEVKRPPDSAVNIYATTPAWDSVCSGLKGSSWTASCFPRCGCADDYCANPYPRQCWPPYPPFYKCVPAGDGGPGLGCVAAKDKLSWWFIPTPQALREAVWWRP